MGVEPKKKTAVMLIRCLNSATLLTVDGKVLPMGNSPQAE
jgi:hypothetical protein